MKKKGLIVSSIVMVLVLVASLTTATYAWFAQSSNATIQNLNVNTVSASGLQIAAVDYNTPAQDKTRLTSGMISYYSAADAYKGDKEGAGSLLDFQNILSTVTGEESASRPGFFACSGDGFNNMVTAYGLNSENSHYEENASSPVVNNKPSFIKDATGKSYLVVDFALFNTAYESSTPYLLLNKLNITASGTNPEIAASMRIALLNAEARDTATMLATGGAQKPTYQPLLCIEPFALMHYVNGAWAKSTYAKTKYISNAIAVGENTTAGEKYYSSGTTVNENLIFKELNNEKVPEEVGPDPPAHPEIPAGTYYGKHFIHKAISFTDSVNKCDLAAIIADTTLTGVKVSADDDKSGIIAGKFLAKNEQATVGGTNHPLYNVVPLRLVIWFEGEDVDCETQFANGGGITFELGFDRCKTQKSIA